MREGKKEGDGSGRSRVDGDEAARGGDGRGKGVVVRLTCVNHSMAQFISDLLSWPHLRISLSMIPYASLVAPFHRVCRVSMLWNRPLSSPRGGQWILVNNGVDIAAASTADSLFLIIYLKLVRKLRAVLDKTSSS